MKKTISIILLFVLILSCIPVYAAQGPIFECSSVSALPGEEIQLELSLEENPGLCGWQTTVTWDKDLLSIDKKGIKRGSLFKSGMFVSNAYASNAMSAIWTSTDASSENGLLFTLTLTVSEYAQKGKYPIEVITSGILNADGEQIPSYIRYGYVTITKNGLTPPKEELPEEPKEPVTPPQPDEPEEPATPEQPEDPQQPEQPNPQEPTTGQPENQPAENPENIPPKPGSPSHGASGSTNPISPAPGGNTEAPAAPTFDDVLPGAYYYDAVLWAAASGITDGTAPRQFSPASPCTRAQIVTFLWRSAGMPAAKNRTNVFTDVAENNYYYEAVLWAKEQGITDGTSASTFSPNTACTRGQVVTFLQRFAAENTIIKTNPFQDISENSYYYEPVLWALENGITDGTSASTFSPNASCTRGQIVTFLYRMNDR